MRVLKLAVISCVILFIIITAIGSLLPRNVLVSRAVDIYAESSVVSKQITDLQNWNNWLPADETVSFAYNNKTNTLHAGNTVVSLKSVTDTLVVSNWKTGSNNMNGKFRIINQPNKIVTVQWQMEEKIGWWPWEKLSSITADKVLGGSMEKSLAKLKSVTEDPQ